MALLTPQATGGLADPLRDEIPTVMAAALVSAYLAGDIDAPDLTRRLVGHLAAARQGLAVVVDALVAKKYKRQPVGFIPDDYSARDEASISTILAKGGGLSAAMQRFVTATCEQAVRDFVIEIGEQHGATSWRWWAYLNGACVDCKTKHGKVFPMTERQHDHPFCSCEPVLLFGEEK